MLITSAEQICDNFHIFLNTFQANFQSFIILFEKQQIKNKNE